MSPRLRLGVLGIVAISLFAALFARLWYLQVLASPTYQVAAERNQVRLVPEPAPRGRILDAHGRILVDNRISRVVTVQRDRLDPDDRELVLARIAAVVGEPVEVLARRLDDPRNSPVLPAVLAEDVSEETVVYVRERPDLFPPDVVGAGERTVRVYPHGTVAAHLLGYVGEINDAELEERRQAGYRLGDEIGKSGVERVYEQDLRGEPGIEKLEVDSHGRVLGSLGRQPPVQGDDVQLTIDLDVQRAAEEALREGLEAARARTDRQTRTRYAAPAGSVVVLDPRDGAVLAMASYPTYNPADFVGGISFGLFQQLQDPANHYPLNNRAIQGEYAPGSTFKLVTAAAAMVSGLIDANTTVLDQGSIRIGNRTFRNAGSRAYGRVALSRAITVSSDVFFYTLGRDFWESPNFDDEGIQKMARQFGLGSETGIPLPFEADGRVPTAEIRRQLHEANPEAFPEGRWFTGDNVNLAIGQGELVVTPLQLANAYATFANGGTRFAPQVARQIRTPAGQTIREIQSVVTGQVELPPHVRDPILDGLVGVTSRSGGTAVFPFAGFDQSSFPVAGKTGTAQVAGKHDTALFAAFAPAFDPSVVVAVVMEESGFGSTAAAPVARRVLEVVSGQSPPPGAEPTPENETPATGLAPVGTVE